jgi:hypothetical protein
MILNPDFDPVLIDFVPTWIPEDTVPSSVFRADEQANRLPRWRIKMPGKAARLQSKAAGQGCQVRLPGKAAG